MGANKSDNTVVAGRGFIFITAAKLYFMVTGAVLMLGLPRLFGSAQLFGDFATVNSLIRIINMVMITATLQAVAKLTSEREETAGLVRWRTVVIQLCIAGTVFVVTFFGADLIAVGLLNDGNLAGYIRISSFIPTFYAFYAIMVGLLNGLKRFFRQALLDVTFSTLKTGLIIVLVLFGYGVDGAFFGFALASALIFAFSLFLTRDIKRTDDTASISFRDVLSYMLPIMAYTLFYNVLLNQDILMIKSLKYQPLFDYFSGPEGRWMLDLHFGMIGIDPTGNADLIEQVARAGTSSLSGIFGAMKTLSNLPYQAVISVTFVVFPLISRSTFDADSETTQNYIRHTFRFSYMVIMLMLAVLLPTAPQLIGLLYGPQYAVGASSLELLLIATVFFSLFVVCTTIITSAGFPKSTLALGIAATTVNTVLCYVLIKRSGLWVDTLRQVAIADCIAMTFGAGLGFLIIWSRLRAMPPFLSFFRITISTAAVCFLGYFLSTKSLLMLLLKCCVLGVTYLVLLVATREIGAADLNVIKRVLARR